MPTSLASWQAGGVRGIDGLRARMIDCWPFTPEFFDILTKKVPNQGGFQNIRGTLRFLAHVVRATHTRRPVVSSQDLPFHENDVHQALANLDTSGGEVVRRALGDNYEAVSKDLPHRDELFSTLVFYSVADPTHPGATLDELLLATLDPGENPLQIRDALAQMKQRAFNLHERDERFVFLAIENPHARINAMAGSQLVTSPAARQHISDTLEHCWGGKERTVLHTAGDLVGTQQHLRKIRARRPRIVLSTVTLLPKDRLQLQNLDEDRNLVLIVEPRVHTSPGDMGYSLLSDETLILHARRIEACKLLLEGRPVPETANVYRQVEADETGRLRKGVSERLGVAIAWHRAGATGAEVDDSWYEVCRLDTPTAEGLLEMWRTDRTGQPEIEHEIRAHWKDFRTHSVAELATWFDRTPGLPMPLEAGWVPTAVRKLAQDGVFGLVAADGAVIQPRRAVQLDDNALASCTLADAVPQVPEPPAEPVARVLARALSPRAADRFVDAPAFREALREWSRGTCQSPPRGSHSALWGWTPSSWPPPAKPPRCSKRSAPDWWKRVAILCGSRSPWSCFLTVGSKTRLMGADCSCGMALAGGLSPLCSALVSPLPARMSPGGGGPPRSVEDTACRTPEASHSSLAIVKVMRCNTRPAVNHSARAPAVRSTSLPACPGWNRLLPTMRALSL